MSKTQLAAVKAGFSRVVRAWKAQIRRNLFAAEILRATARAEGAQVPFGVTLTLGDRRAEVAVTHLTDPDTAHADIARLLRAVADEFDPATGGAQDDAADDDQGDDTDQADTPPARYRDAAGDLWERVDTPLYTLAEVGGVALEGPAPRPLEYVRAHHGPLTPDTGDQ